MKPNTPLKPNVLWIFTDQHRGQAMSCAGDPNIETPNLDRLGREGVRFTNAYSNTPICTPARANVYTGQYITSHGALANHYPLLPARSPQMAQVMAAAGYRTCHYGKWHLCGGSAGQHYVSPYFRPGWHEWIGWECMHAITGAGTYYDSGYCEGVENVIKLHRIDKFQPDWLTDRTIDWLGKQTPDQPWFHVVSIETPHSPCDFPRNVSVPHYRLFEHKALQLRPNFSEERREELDGFIRGYYSHVANIDGNVGRIVNALDKNGQLEDTIVFYFSDHGDNMGSHGRGGKSRPEEEASNIPFLIRLPECLHAPRTSDRIASPRAASGKDSASHAGPAAAQTTNAFISLVDLMPTTLGLCGIPVPDSCEGSDLSALVRGDTDRGPGGVFLQFENGFFGQTRPEGIWRAIRRGEWMYCVNMAQGPYELFNLSEDPYEMDNLVDDPGHAKIRSELHDRMTAKARELGDDFFQRLKAAF